MKLILASASPRRAQILRAAGYRFETLSTETDESQLPGESAAAMVQRLAAAKARAALLRVRKIQDGGQPAIVLAADTTVELEGHVLGKPESPDEARSMLERLSGKTHFVHTGMALIRLPEGTETTALETTAVHFKALRAEEIDGYVATGEPLDKAGGYGIQGAAGQFVEGLEGCYYNVMGLPLERVEKLLKDLGWAAETDQTRTDKE